MANQNYLAELILSIHNEVQTAVDYIEQASIRAGTEVGRSEAILQIENLRIKLPFLVEIENKNLNVGVQPIAPELATAEQLRKMLSTRKGFMLDLGGAGVKANFTKVKVDIQPNQPGSNPDALCGEIEIAFSPLQRK
jgi:hypothetical protein